MELLQLPNIYTNWSFEGFGYMCILITLDEEHQKLSGSTRYKKYRILYNKSGFYSPSAKQAIYLELFRMARADGKSKGSLGKGIGLWL